MTRRASSLLLGRGGNAGAAAEQKVQHDGRKRALGFEFHKCYVEDTPRQRTNYCSTAPMHRCPRFWHFIAASFTRTAMQCHAMRVPDLESASNMIPQESRRRTEWLGGGGEWSQVMHDLLGPLHTTRKVVLYLSLGFVGRGFTHED